MVKSARGTAPCAVPPLLICHLLDGNGRNRTTVPCGAATPDDRGERSGRRSARLQKRTREPAEDERQLAHIGGELVEERLSPHRLLVHIERAVDLDLQAVRAV